ncbi:hypothetical protein EMCRGX_G026517 [Ephydatia muelleri]
MRRSIALCTAIEVPNGAWCQAQLGLKFGGLGLRSVSLHAAAAFMASLSSSGFGSADYIHLQQAVVAFNSQVSLPNAITVISVLASPTPTQKVLSGMIEDQLFSTSLESSSHANRACLLSMAAPHSSSWLSVVPSPGLGLHLESNEYPMAIKWWLGLHGHFRYEGDVVIRHNCLRDEIFDLCRHAHLSVRLEKGNGVTRDLDHTRPADILIARWARGKPAALDHHITPLPSHLRIGEPLLSDTDCPMFELSRNIEAVEGCKVLKAVSFVHDCFSEGCHFEEMLLDVEPFHGFVVSDYIALFCVNRAHLGVPWRIGEKEKAMEIDSGRGVVFELDSFDQRLTLLDIKTPVRLVLSFTG